MVSSVTSSALTASSAHTRATFRPAAPRAQAPRTSCVRVQALSQDQRTAVQAGASALAASAAALILALPGASVAAVPSFKLADVTGTEQSSRTGLGPNEVDVKDLESFPNASKKDAAVPSIQKYAEPPEKQAPKPVPDAIKQGVESVEDKKVGALLGQNVFSLADVTGTEQSSRKGLGPNEVDVKDLQSLPNASKKDSATPKIQEYGKLPKKQAPKAVPEAVKQGVESVSDKGKKGGKDAAGAAKKAASKATGSPQFEAFLRRIRGGK